MSDVQLGFLAPEDAGRDATHVAVVPMIAADDLRPGTHVAPLGDGTAGSGKEPIGIVDPFLSGTVKKGERFFLCLYPRTVTGLRHVYKHPVLDSMTDPEPKDAKAASEKWLRDFVATSDCPGYEQVIAKALDNQNSRFGDAEYLFFRDQDAHGEIPDAFWDHLEVVTGQKLTQRARAFSCSC